VNAIAWMLACSQLSLDSMISPLRGLNSSATKRSLLRRNNKHKNGGEKFCQGLVTLMESRVKCLEPQARGRKKASLIIRQMKAAMASYKGLYLAPSEADDAY